MTLDTYSLRSIFDFFVHYAGHTTPPFKLQRTMIKHLIHSLGYALKLCPIVEYLFVIFE